jgi:serine/threonine protein phosphatase PrpC
MARSIGDHAVKAVGVTAEPEVRMRKILPGDRFIVIASDGVSHLCSYALHTHYIDSHISARISTILSVLRKMCTLLVNVLAHCVRALASDKYTLAY